MLLKKMYFCPKLPFMSHLTLFYGTCYLFAYIYHSPNPEKESLQTQVAQLKGTAELSTMADSKPNKVTEAMEIPSLLSKRLSCGTKETTITINGIIVDLESFQREEESW